MSWNDSQCWGYSHEMRSKTLLELFAVSAIAIADCTPEEYVPSVGVVRQGSDNASAGGDTAGSDSIQGDRNQGDFNQGDFNQGDSATLPPPDLECTPPVTVGSNPEGIGEPGVRTDGLTVISKRGPSRLHCTRATLSDSFGAWSTPPTPLLPTDEGDRTFFDYDGAERAMITGVPSGAGRALQYCATLPTDTCTWVTLIDDTTGLELTDGDYDGPDLATPGTDIYLSVNLDTPVHESDIFIGWPETPGDLSRWRITSVLAINTAHENTDDAAFSADGTVLIFSSNPSGTDGDLWYVSRNSTSEPFDAVPKLLSDASTVGFGDNSPALFQHPDGSLELFFVSTRVDSVSRIYRTTCVKTPA